MNGYYPRKHKCLADSLLEEERKDHTYFLKPSRYTVNESRYREVLLQAAKVARAEKQNRI